MMGRSGLVPIGAFARVGSGTTPSRALAARYFSSSGHPWVKTGDLTNSIVRATDERITDAAISETGCRLYPAGSVLVAMYGGYRQIGRTGLLEAPAAVNQAISVIQVDPELVDSKYLLHYLNYRVGGWKRFAASSRKDPNITRQDVEEFPVLLPPIADQQRIAEVLETWDKAIRANVDLLEARRTELRALRVRIFGEGGHLSTATTKKLSEISTRVRSKSEGGTDPVMTISSKSGFVLQSDKYSRDMAGMSVVNYTKLSKGEFAYNKGNSFTYPQGCIFPLTVPTALVPNVYYCFRLDPDLTPRFYEHLFAAGALNRQLARVINSGVRNNGLLNLDAEEFFACHVPVPSQTEQNEIAAVFDAAVEELSLLDRLVEQLRIQKSGLMQTLLTGSVQIADEEDRNVA